ncbi:beta-ketoacyl-ACP synthase II [Streptomyces sp. NPDC044780]|uniref:beta-ketoacyl-[acyl-carrier-protein] synthase family protein n=1 Tax=unclassified Streptomyces TaxID=2593676 RepID=UPI0022A83F69|nr:beta-ketoacyl-ACP synthase II [Streptomyces sp. S465]WAP54872.1 beta-ketoacyl-ACP synthase II [Streptomyces sp. S465]
MAHRDVVVTGVGAVTALGSGAGPLHERAVAGESALAGGEGRCTGFDPSAVLSRREARRTDRFSQFALVAAAEALGQAGWDGRPPYAPERVACVVGSGVGGLETFEGQRTVLDKEGPEAVSPLMVPMMMANAAAAQIALRHGLGGESHCVISACSAGAQAIGAGLRLIRSGAADAVVVGGAEAATSPIVRAAFLNAGALSPSGASVPFDRSRDGFLLGEGAGILVLEGADGARARGATVLAELAGYGASSDAHHLTAPDPDGVGAARAVSLALADAGIAPGDLDYINAHGTGTVLNDQAEIVALRRSLGPVLEDIPLSSTKSSIGHLLGAAGAVEAVATVLALRHRQAPPTVGLATPDPALGPLTHLTTARPLARGGPGGPVALSTSFGFGGHNAALVLRGAPEGAAA